MPNELNINQIGCFPPGTHSNEAIQQSDKASDKNPDINHDFNESVDIRKQSGSPINLNGISTEHPSNQRKIPGHLYEKTNNSFEEKLLNEEFTDKPLTSEKLLSDNSAIILKEVISLNECIRIKNIAKNFCLEDVSAFGYSKKIRNCDRVSFNSNTLASELYGRLSQSLPIIPIDHTNGPSENGLINSDLPPGHWSPYGLNPCFRLIRYEAGGEFKPHLDEGIFISNKNRSLKSVIIYLNNSGTDYLGGETAFFSSQQIKYMPPNSEYHLNCHSAQAGECLLMNHRVLHGGNEVTEGEKWILRTDIVYEYIPNQPETEGSITSKPTDNVTVDPDILAAYEAYCANEASADDDPSVF